ncbi:MAG: ABC transporter ATP-binding protein [Candidatus Hepatoplasma scabrum]|nr:MAG: ABC transporter ATP-binding protein [Candidatus Hepatoplasma sp.]
MIIKINNLNKIIKTKTEQKYILKDINFLLPKNKILAICGETGSGKTTLARIIGGFSIPTFGSINYNYAFFTNKTAQNKIKYKNLKAVRFFSKITFQDSNLQFFKQNVWDEIAFSFKNIGYKNDFLTKKIEEVFSFLDFPKNYKNLNPNNLSGGEQKKLLIAIIAFLPSKLLILDEPTASLDHHNRIEVLNFIKKISTKNKTIIMITHDLRNLYFSDYLLFLKEGKQITFTKSSILLKDQNNLNQVLFESSLIAKKDLKSDIFAKINKLPWK